ncbi:MAG TPA: hypothetical protein VMS73_04625 [Anaerolineaceae bacterium]|nr:hypothetical protein [Anaerolineaceae bacterium]
MAQPVRNKQPRRGIIEEIGLEVNLFVSLILDRRVSILLKLIPLAGLLYLVNPIDFPGWLDDAFVVIVSLVLFFELCPRAVVEEHRDRLRRVIPGKWHDPTDNATIIDGEFRDAPEDKPEDQNVKK